MDTINREDAKSAKVGTIGGFDPEIERLAHEVLGAAIEVHRILGPRFLESVYEEAMSVEMRLREIAFERQVPVSVSYKGSAVGKAGWISWLAIA